MPQPKQVPLNGAYYGPPIPSQQAPHQPHRGCCLLSALIKFMAVFIIVSGITTVVLWIILSPSNMTVHVEKASLMQFNLTNGATLNYNLTLEMSRTDLGWNSNWVMLNGRPPFISVELSFIPRSFVSCARYMAKLRLAYDR
ncbi:hypothetical protein AAC387_Pa05g2893 [Persea americana]